MIVNVVECLAGARKARGLVVVIDVFRAFSVACYAVDNGVNEYIAVDKIDLAREIAAEKGGVLIGERDCIKVEGFDHGNSPTEIEHVDFSGRTMVHTTSAGTQGLVAVAPNADEVLTGSFVNAKAIVDYIKQKEPELVTVVAMGTAGVMRAQEDMMCAMYIKNELDGYPNSFETLKKFLAGVDSAEKRDFELCMDIDRFDFVLRATLREGGGMQLEKITVEPSAEA